MSEFSEVIIGPVPDPVNQKDAFDIHTHAGCSLVYGLSLTSVNFMQVLPISRPCKEIRSPIMHIVYHYSNSRQLLCCCRYRCHRRSRCGTRLGQTSSQSKARELLPGGDEA